ncbi:hypothetical protein H2203_009251 [Taxawa tesnikishii (nom. ined.)]|nr:hypothetical protein H2203_009251 [Dothideales sp. JES 119]
MISSYLSVSAVYAAPDDGRIGDPSQVVAPGCTVGCQTCRINGGTVQLIYWSPRTINPSNNRTSNATSLVTAVGLGTTFTSPTVYISFDSLYASNSCGTFGQKYSNTIIPVDPADLSSIWGYQRYNALGWTTSFNFTDLYVTPVPNSIYQTLQPESTIAPATISVPVTIVTTAAEPSAAINPSTAPNTASASISHPSTFVKQSSAALVLPSVVNPEDLSSQPLPTATALNSASLDQPTGANTIVPVQFLSTDSVSKVAATTAASRKPAGDVSSDSLQTEEISQTISAVNSDDSKTSADSPDPANNILSILSNAEASSPAQNTNPSTTPSITFSAGGQQFTAIQSGSVILVGSQALSAGGPAATINGQHVSVDSSGVVVGNGAGASTIPYVGTNTAQAQSGSNPEGVVTVGSEVYTAAAGSNGANVVANAGSTITVSAGSPGATINGQVVSAAPGNVVIGSGSQASTIAVAGDSHASSAFTIGSHTFTAAAQTNGALVFADAQSTFTLSPEIAQTNGARVLAIGSDTFTLSAGGIAATINGQAMSAMSNGIVVGSGADASTVNVPFTESPANVLTVGSHMFTEIAQTGDEMVFGGSQQTFTLSRGGAPITIGTEVVSVASSGRIVVGGGTLAAFPLQTNTVVVGSQTLVEVDQTNGAAVFSGVQTKFTLVPGGTAATVGSQVVSAASGGNIIIGGSAVTLSPASATAARSVPSVIILGSQTFTEIMQSNGQDVFANAHTTFTISTGGPAATVGGQRVSAADNSHIVVGSSTVQIQPKESVFVVGSETVTASADGSEGQVFAIGSSKATLSAGGPAVSIGSQVISEDLNGQITTLPVATSGGSDSVATPATSSQSGGGRLCLDVGMWIFVGIAGLSVFVSSQL